MSLGKQRQLSHKGNLKRFVLKSVLSDSTFMQQKRKQVDKGIVNPGYRGLFQETENPSPGTSCYLVNAFNSSAQENTAKTTST